MALFRNSRKTIAEKFEEENLLQIRAAEAEIRDRVSVADLMRSTAEGTFLDLLTPGPEKKAWATISRSKIVELLQVAGKEDSEAFKHVLSRLLRLWGITPPPNTFTQWKAVRGAPLKPTTQEIRARWEQDGKPKISNKLCLAYAKSFYPSEYAKAKLPQSQRKLINRVRTPLLKYQKALMATESFPAIRSAK